MYCDFIFSFHEGQRKRFRDGSLVSEWFKRYPHIFDDDDVRVLNTPHQRRHHFFEWLSAVLLFESTGYSSMVEKYTSKKHLKKREKLQEIVTPNVFDWLCKNGSGQPDLFVYESTTGDWFLCEVKGGPDRLQKNQINWMNQFKTLLNREGISSQKRIRVLCLWEVRS